MNKRLMSRYEAIVIGASAGGFEALKIMLAPLPEDLPLPIIIVQHIHATSDGFLAHHLNNQCKLRVKQAEEREKILAAQVYLAPPGYHLLIEENRTFSLSIDASVNYSRPSIDVLFESAADAYRNKLIGIILTGANADGSRGLKTIKKKGGLSLVQNPEEATVNEMPLAALATEAVDRVLMLSEIPVFLLEKILHCQESCHG